ncbi:feruloyl esterase B precursor [Fusarium phyllophilum]|uniref:Carboxylic ester hydrolase n=1 Tax=Fusarium phyllophilum TaxID=47803 RepID=A0A8H5I6J8_9HYPO|nr:feruloyl esterase B precursor [Fusarium phyllophilum]
MRFSFATTLAIATTCLATNLTARCHRDIINFPNIPGTHNVKVVASAAENFRIEAENSQSSKVQYNTLGFCNVTIRLPRGASFRDLASTQCNGTVYTGRPYAITSNWIGFFVLQNPNYNLTKLSSDDFVSTISRSIATYKSVASTDNPDLKDFKDSGGKMLHWHGTADAQIFEQGSSYYYNRVEARDAGVREYYRYFQAPGAAHCNPGTGFHPSDALSRLVDWVEKGQAPDALLAAKNGGETRLLRPYPLSAL